MTGYGKGSTAAEACEATVEVRSVNSRYLDISIKLPKALESREGHVRDTVRKNIERGRISVSIVFRREDDGSLALKINEPVVDGYKALLEKLQQRLAIEAPLKIEHLLSFPDLFVQDENQVISDTGWEIVEQSLQTALSELNQMRRREGEEIEKDLLYRIGLINEKIQKIEEIASNRSGAEFQKLYQRIKTMVSSGELDATRLETEVALLADRIDVTEECIRFKSHNTLFVEAIHQPEPVGRKLNFLLQEMNREANTIGAKANEAEISHLVVAIKEEVEKVREQVQNIE